MLDMMVLLQKIGGCKQGRKGLCRVLGPCEITGNGTVIFEITTTGK